MRQKGFAPVLIILLIAVLGVVGYLGYKNYYSKIQTSTLEIQPTQMPSSIVYSTVQSSAQNSGFTVNVPEGQAITTEKTGNDLHIFKNGPSTKENSVLTDGFSIILISKNSEGKTLEKWFDDSIDQNDKVVKPKTKVVVNNYPGFSITFTSASGSYTSPVQFIVLQSPYSENEFVYIQEFVVDPSNLGFQKTVDQIVSTLKFTGK